LQLPDLDNDQALRLEVQRSELDKWDSLAMTLGEFTLAKGERPAMSPV
jgi:hypothetical protein